MSLKIYRVYTGNLSPDEKEALETNLDNLAFLTQWNPKFIQVTWDVASPFPPSNLSLSGCRFEDVTNLQ